MAQSAQKEGFMQLTRWQKLRMRTFLLAAGMVRHVTLGVRVALIEDDRIFLIRHSYVPGWQLPGGGVEPGESAAAAAERELIEETGFAPAGPLTLFGFYHQSNAITDRDHVAVYLCRQHRVERPFRPGLEISGCDWFALDDPPEGIADSAARRMAEIAGTRPQSPLW
jgi:8-oxo-dGTP pyrophosphatase MutT (NUDIX family)